MTPDGAMTMRSKVTGALRMVAAAALLLAPAVTPSVAGAQQDRVLDSLRAQWRVKLPAGYEDAAVQPRAFPATNGATPSAYGPSWGEAFVGAGYQGATRSERLGGRLNGEDGAVLAGFGVGNSRTVGLEVVYTSFSTVRSGFFKVGGVSLKLHRAFENGWGVALGRERAVVLGGSGDGGSATYGVVSKMFFRNVDARSPFSAYGFSLGVGEGRFQNYDALMRNQTGYGVFGAVSARVAEPLNVIADWNGQDLALSASLVPLRCLPMVITPGIADVTQRSGRPRFILGVGMGFRPEELVEQVSSCFGR